MQSQPGDDLASSVRAQVFAAKHLVTKEFIFFVFLYCKPKLLAEVDEPLRI